MTSRTLQGAVASVERDGSTIVAKVLAVPTSEVLSIGTFTAAEVRSGTAAAKILKMAESSKRQNEQQVKNYEAKIAKENERLAAATSDTEKKWILEDIEKLKAELADEQRSLASSQAAVSFASGDLQSLLDVEAKAIEDAQTAAAEEAKAAEAKAAAETPDTPTDSAAETVKAQQASGDSTASTQKPQDTPPVTGPVTAKSTAPTAEAKPPSKDDAELKTANKAPPVAGASGPPAPVAVIRENPLRRFSSYTYNISLEMTDTKSYNEMIGSNPTAYNADRWVPIISTGGIGPNKATWPKGSNGQKYFQRDFYIDNLRMTSIIGSTSDARGTNVNLFNFTITEPFGISLIEELYDFTHDALKEENYLELPFMLKVKFIGYDDNGKLIDDSERLTKYLPLKIVKMDLKVTNAGAVYECEGIPYSDQSKGDKYGKLGKDIELKGKTITDICQGKHTEGSKGGVNITGLAEVMTKDSQDLTKPKDEKDKNSAPQDTYDEYSIEFVKTTIKIGDKTEDIDIGTFELASPEEISRANTPMGTPPTGNSTTNSSTTAKPADADPKAIGSNLLAYQYLSKDAPKVDIDTKTSVVKFKAGSGIFDIVGQLIQSSKYITTQLATFREEYNKIIKIEDPDKRRGELKKLAKPIKWFKLIPEITFKEYDKKRNTYGKKIKIKVIPYLIDDPKVPFAPKQQPTDRVSKRYDYIFTGNNSEVINFDLTFNSAFMQYATVNYDTKAQSQGAKKPSEQTEVQRSPVKGPVTEGRQVVNVSNSPANPRGIGQVTPDRARSADMAASIYAKADLLTVDLEIMGDPDYIKQDDIFKKPHDGDVASSTLEGGNGQPEGIAMDNGAIYAELNFLTPQDYDDDKGLMQVNIQAADTKEYRRSVFSGVYNVLEVATTLNGGKFTQKLNCARFDEEGVALEDPKKDDSKKEDKKPESKPDDPKSTPPKG